MGEVDAPPILIDRNGENRGHHGQADAQNTRCQENLGQRKAATATIRRHSRSLLALALCSGNREHYNARGRGQQWVVPRRTQKSVGTPTHDIADGVSKDG
jgi:hypothetical protein